MLVAVADVGAWDLLKQKKNINIKNKTSYNIAAKNAEINMMDIFCKSTQLKRFALQNHAKLGATDLIASCRYHVSAIRD